MLAQQLKSILPYIARYEQQIAQLFDSHPDSFLFRDLPGAGSALAPRLLTAFGTNRDRFTQAIELACLSGIAPVRKASGKSSLTHMRWACPKFLRQSFHEFAGHSIRSCPGPTLFIQRNAFTVRAVRSVAFNLSGSASCLLARNSAPLTIPLVISKLSNPEVRNTQNSLIKTTPHGM